MCLSVCVFMKKGVNILSATHAWVYVSGQVCVSMYTQVNAWLYMCEHIAAHMCKTDAYHCKRKGFFPFKLWNESNIQWSRA